MRYFDQPMNRLPPLVAGAKHDEKQPGPQQKDALGPAMASRWVSPVSIERVVGCLLERGIMVVDVKAISYGKQVRLGCGVVVNVYQTGKVLVQGKLPYPQKDQLLALLVKLLPPDTRWQLKE